MKFEKATVEWEDVSKMTNDDNFDEGSDIDKRLSKMKTIGWIFQETEKVIILVQEFDGEKPRDWVAIPKSLIIKIKKENGMRRRRE